MAPAGTSSYDDHPHPGITGRVTEMADLTRAVRRLIAATVLNRAPARSVAEIAAGLHTLADRLERHIPDPPPPVTNMTRTATNGAAAVSAGGDAMAENMAYDVVIGPYSPLAVPVSITFDPPKAIGRARFSLPYEGPPGCVHGAVIAATFDIVLTAANIVGGAAGPTVSLTTRYLRPTLLHEEASFEAWVDRTEGRRVFTRGRLVQRGATTVEAEGTFALIDHSRTRRLGEERRSSGR
ncbi:MAG: PaaI family thioesterase [Actinobacteria bacterium]|nr:PaaI family thioesterase [Actinomycetota bacterium]